MSTGERTQPKIQPISQESNLLTIEWAGASSDTGPLTTRDQLCLGMSMMRQACPSEAERAPDSTSACGHAVARDVLRLMRCDPKHAVHVAIGQASKQRPTL